jgi:molybdopterin-guanine dinucleotide biosynthesis protein B
VVGITGPSNSGKTTLIEKLIQIALQRGVKVGVVKHDPKDKSQLDTPGKDSWKFFQQGADVLLLSPVKTGIFLHRPLEFEEIFQLFSGYDLILVEGLKTLPLRRLGVFRGRIEEEYLPFVEGVAVDSSIPQPHRAEVEGRGIKVFDLNHPLEIWEWIYPSDTPGQGGRG